MKPGMQSVLPATLGRDAKLRYWFPQQLTLAEEQTQDTGHGAELYDQVGIDYENRAETFSASCCLLFLGAWGFLALPLPHSHRLPRHAPSSSFLR